MAINEHIPIENQALFPLLQPSGVFSFAENISIIHSLSDCTGDGRYEVNILLTDYEAFYRSLVPRIIWLWTTLILMLHDVDATTSVFTDLGTYFGDRGAATTANRVMNVSLFFWFAILLCILEPYTTYDVTSRSERPHVKLLLSAHSNQAARQAADHIRSMAPDIPSAHKWDSPAAVRGHVPVSIPGRYNRRYSTRR
eukprot:COSAG01_NODE_9744_length_2356_cov_3.062472_3_plen_197_part_00